MYKKDTAKKVYLGPHDQTPKVRVVRIIPGKLNPNTFIMANILPASPSFVVVLSIPDDF